MFFVRKKRLLFFYKTFSMRCAIYFLENIFTLAATNVRKTNGNIASIAKTSESALVGFCIKFALIGAHGVYKVCNRFQYMKIFGTSSFCPIKVDQMDYVNTMIFKALGEIKRILVIGFFAGRVAFSHLHYFALAEGNRRYYLNHGA